MPVDFEEPTTYRVVLIAPHARAILARRGNHGLVLPSIRIAQGVRTAREIQNEIRAKWDLQALILDILVSPAGMSSCAIAEVLTHAKDSEFAQVSPGDLLPDELSEQETSALDVVLSGTSESLFANPGWLDKVRPWVEQSTGEELQSDLALEQLNAGGGNAVVRFLMRSGRTVWLKAAGSLNHHELPVTQTLSEICGRYLPTWIDSRPEWNAWLTEGQSVALAEAPTEPEPSLQFLKAAVESMAELQLKTCGRTAELLEAGAFDQRQDALLSHADEIFARGYEAMSLQTSTRAPRIERARLCEIREILERLCDLQASLGIQDMILHGDLNSSNILIGKGDFQFVDWCEAYVGNPLVSFEHLLLLYPGAGNAQKDASARSLKELYKGKVSTACNPDAVERGFLYSPILAAYSALLGRGSWLSESIENDLRRQKYIRMLVRYMDVAARETELLEFLHARVCA